MALRDMVLNLIIKNTNEEKSQKNNVTAIAYKLNEKESTVKRYLERQCEKGNLYKRNAIYYLVTDKKNKKK